MSFATNTAPPRTALTGNAAELFVRHSTPSKETCLSPCRRYNVQSFSFPFQSPESMADGDMSLTMALQDNLTLNDKPPSSNNSMRPPPRSSTGDKQPPLYTSTARGENVPPGARHRPTRSQEEAMRARRIAGGQAKPQPSAELDIFADPTEPTSSRRPDGRRMRRNSDSSLVDRKSLDPEEEKKKQEKRRQERKERREREGRDPKTGKPNRKLDIIDKLDVTSIYGTGCEQRFAQN